MVTVAHRVAIILRNFGNAHWSATAANTVETANLRVRTNLLSNLLEYLMKNVMMVILFRVMDVLSLVKLNLAGLVQTDYKVSKMKHPGLNLNVTKLVIIQSIKHYNIIDSSNKTNFNLQTIRLKAIKLANSS